ncbi:DUF2852 domain-containing protein [Sulfitobacter sp. JL08]|uniref:DUF2852 domain-containing protein n=1 Tax=Sulfitobacter sp. JL08 TaxID=2070369 RepID=UPI001966AD5A|nr:DUF2852 domain-containing protein [Sulfitobacter sp. JL08]
MSTVTHPTQMTGPRFGWLSRTEAWLDDKGKGAWIAAMALGFIFFWPVGLALLFYMIWSKRMFNSSCSRRTNAKAWSRTARTAMSTTGNSAFDAYKADTLRRLEEEQMNFESFLERLREAKDKSEFDQFMDERARKAKSDATNADDASDKTI